MKHRILFSNLFVLCTLFASPIRLSAQDAFYIYQNDGHFDGFFYDHIEEMSYSPIDTAGVEYNYMVTQIIVTTDSTYRIMLSAIDSISFVQPEIKLNPHLRKVREEGLINYITSRESLRVIFSSSMPENMRPQVGDVLADFDIDEGWGGKVRSITPTADGLIVQCDELEDISDIFQQFVSVEQIDKDSQGRLIRRRVAGMPESNIGHFGPRRENSFEGNIFNFTLGGHLPIYTSSGGDVNISIDPNITAALSVKCVWNLPMWGEKYISFTKFLDLEASLGFTVDGKISDVFPAGVNQFGKMPVPATAPIFVLDFGPDGFLRGEWHGKFSGETPKAKGRIWEKWEIRDWWPSWSCGFGNPEEDKKEQDNKHSSEEDENNASLSVEFNGFVQTGVSFPLKIRSNRLIQKLFDSELGGTLYIGPKLSGAVTLDLRNVLFGDNTLYSNFKDSKLTVNLINADYEIKAKVKSLFTDNREWTVADGSMNLFGDINLYFFPEFDSPDDRTHETTTWNMQKDTEHTIVFAPKQRSVLAPLRVGAGFYRIKPDGTEETLNEWWQSYDYYQLYNWVVNKREEFYPRIIFREGNLKAGEYKVRPIFKFLGKTIQATPEYTFNKVGAIMELSADTLFLDYKGRTIEPITIQGNCTNFKLTDWWGTALSNLDYTIQKEGDRQALWCNRLEPNMHFTDSVFIQGLNFIGSVTISDSTYQTRKEICVCLLPNTEELPIKCSCTLSSTNEDSEWTTVTDFNMGGDNITVTRQDSIIHVTISVDNKTFDTWTGSGSWVTYDATAVTSYNVSFDIIAVYGKPYALRNGRMSGSYASYRKDKDESHWKWGSGTHEKHFSGVTFGNDTPMQFKQWSYSNEAFYSEITCDFTAEGNVSYKTKESYGIIDKDLNYHDSNIKGIITLTFQEH